MAGTPRSKAWGREVWLLPEDEDALVAELRAGYGRVLVMAGEERYVSPRAPRARWPSDIPIGVQYLEERFCTARLMVYIPGPGWRLRLRRYPDGDRDGERAWMEPRTPLLYLRIDRISWLKEPTPPDCLQSGFIQTSGPTQGPGAGEYAEFLRFVIRAMRRVATNKLVLRKHDEQGRVVSEEPRASSFPSYWAGWAARRWALQPGRHLLHFNWTDRPVGLSFSPSPLTARESKREAECLRRHCRRPSVRPA